MSIRTNVFTIESSDAMHAKRGERAQRAVRAMRVNETTRLHPLKISILAAAMLLAACTKAPVGVSTADRVKLVEEKQKSVDAANNAPVTASADPSQPSSTAGSVSR